MSKRVQRYGDIDASDIRDGMARALWVTAYADFADEADDEDQYPRARGGQDWMDVAPETPDAAYKAADDLVALFVAKNDVPDMLHLFKTAMAVGGPAADPGEFGHYMAMEALGHGVSWFDDHPKFEVKFPHFECHFDGDELYWSGEGSHKNPRSNDALDIPGVTNPAIRVGSRVSTPFGNGVVMKTKASKNIPGGRLVNVMLEGDDEAFENIPIDQVTVIGPHPTSFAARRINPAGVLTAKGERMYEEIKRGYEEKGDPRAAEIAMRTVYAKAKEGVTGLLRVGRGRPPGVPSKGE